jgi:hypothetical protein
MKSKSILISIAVGLSVILAGILVIFPLSGCNNHVPCCPHIVEFKSQYEWVCTKPECGDTGTKVTLEVLYHKGGESLCTLSNLVDQVKVENVTENFSISSSNWKEVPTGKVKSIPGGVFVGIKKQKGDVTLRLTATGETGCSTETKDITVKVVFQIYWRTARFLDRNH